MKYGLSRTGAGQRGEYPEPQGQTLYMEGVQFQCAKLVELQLERVTPVVATESPPDMVYRESVYLAVKTFMRLMDVLLAELEQALQCQYRVIGFLLCLLCGG